MNLIFFSFEAVAGPLAVLFLGFLVVFWIYCLVDILISRFRGAEKLLWFLLVFMAPGIGTIIYLLLGRRTRKHRRRFQPFIKQETD